MKVPGQISWFKMGLALIALVAVGEGWCIFERAQAAVKAEKLLVKKRRELASVLAATPAPTAENAAAIEADLARTQYALELMRAGLQGRAAAGLRAKAAPERRPEAFFDIAGFVEQMRERARQAGVGVKTEERFGFEEYSNAGPELELIPAVFRQRLLAQHLLESLFEARPRELLSFQRERPTAKIEPPAAGGAVPTTKSGANFDSAADYFEIDPRVSARVPGFVETMAFRLTFIGQTNTLRAWLNRLAAFDLPLVVRSVEVEATTVEGPDGRDAAKLVGPPEATPLIRRTPSRFTVTVEYIDLVEPKGEAG